MAQDAEGIAKTFQNYVQAFQSLQPNAAAEYCQSPCLFISADGVLLMANRKELKAFVGQLTMSLKARGFARSEIIEMRVNQMSGRIALVSVRKVRYRTDGSELEQLGETYTMRKVDGDWKIVAAMVHDPAAILALV